MQRSRRCGVARRWRASSPRRAGHPRRSPAPPDWVLSVAGNPRITAVWQATMLKSRVYVYRAMKRTAGARTAPIIKTLIRSILAAKPSRGRLRAT